MNLPSSWPANWDYSTPLPGGTVVVERESYELFVEALRAHGSLVPEDQKALIVAGHFVDRLHLVAVLEGHDYSQVHPVDALTAFVSRLCVGFADFSPSKDSLETAWNVAKRADSNLAAFAPSLDLLLHLYAFLDDLYSDCALEQTTIHYGARPSWWTKRTNIVSGLQTWRKKLEAEIAQGRNVAAFKKKIDDILVVLGNLDLIAAPQEVVFASASAFCFAASEVQLAKSRAPAALLLALRCIEYLLIAIGYRKGAVTVTRNAVLIGKVDLTVAELIKELKRTGNLSTGTSDQLLAINSTRNDLSLTHGFSTVSLQETRTIVGALEGTLAQLDSTLGWRAKLRQVRPRLPGAHVALAAAIDFPLNVESMNAQQLNKAITTPP
jgi:hypothetical protein